MRRTLTVLALLAFLAAGLAGLATTGVASSVATAASTVVGVHDNYYSPKSKTVSHGTRLTFRWRGSAPHNVRVYRGPSRFHSAVKSSGSYRTPALKHGTYVLYCSIHGRSVMSMKVTVR